MNQNVYLKPQIDNSFALWDGYWWGNLLNTALIKESLNLV